MPAYMVGEKQAEGGLVVGAVLRGLNTRRKSLQDSLLDSSKSVPLRCSTGKP